MTLTNRQSPVGYHLISTMILTPSTRYQLVTVPSADMIPVVTPLCQQDTSWLPISNYLFRQDTSWLPRNCAEKAALLQLCEEIYSIMATRDGGSVWRKRKFHKEIYLVAEIQQCSDNGLVWWSEGDRLVQWREK
ncbi:hypothetical protein TIFTF001_007556 [Ficus carica]|uniref:Uncharacterized protein n=1 Tax=Ficus carica TaxID=3494 RepID=A0AA88CZS7_FICCA|nr:hypothetical protein TIFTF001_007556 [Ficus carica]